MEEVLIPGGIGLASALVGGVICYFLTRHGSGTAVAILLALMTGFLLWLWLQARAAIGWDALGYALGAMLFVAPAIVGGLLGSLIGRYRRKRASSQEPR